MAEIKFTEQHEWLRIEDGVATVGITDHAQESLGDIVFVELPEVGRQLAAGEACAVVESTKAASEVYAPLAGRIVSVNEDVIAEPALVNRAPTAEGWFFKLQLDDPGTADGLMDEARYQEFVGGQR